MLSGHVSAATFDDVIRQNAETMLDDVKLYRQTMRSNPQAIMSWLKRRYPDVQTTLGVSNISFGLSPAARIVLNSVFLHECVKAGLDSAIVHAATEHSLVLMEYLRRFRPDLVPTEEELHEVRFEFDPAPALETLMLHFCGEIRLNHWYRRAAQWHTEPVIKHIYETLARDEARHGGAYLRYMKKYMGDLGDTARAAFAKIGVLMASAKGVLRAGPSRQATTLPLRSDNFTGFCPAAIVFRKLGLKEGPAFTYPRTPA